MGAVINMANEKQAYTLSDRGTFIAYRAKANLGIIHEGDQILINKYSVIAVNPEKHPHVNYKLTMKFIEYLISEEGQKIISDYKINGEQLFFTYTD